MAARGADRPVLIATCYADDVTATNPSERRRSCFGTKSALCAIVLAFLVSGCATEGGGYLEPVLPVGATLAPEFGYVLVQVDTDVPIEWITITGATISYTLPEGETTWLVALPAGPHEWRRIMPGASTGLDRSIDLRDYQRLRKRDDWVWDDEFEFDVEAGKVNYPGTLLIRSGSGSSSKCCLVRVRNQSARAVFAASETYGEILGGLPLRHSGAGGDGFLDYYTKLRDALRSPGASPP